MKKGIILSALSLCLVALSGKAQNSLLATLHHDGEISTFYGATALQDAHAAAANGDVITLSAGNFLATDLTKAVTLRGAGMDTDSATQRFPTVLMGDFDIHIPDTVSQRLVLEGLWHNDRIRYQGTLRSPQFLKCRLGEVANGVNAGVGKLLNADFIHCWVVDGLTLVNGSGATCIASVIVEPYTNGSDNSFVMENCVIMRTDLGSNYIRTSGFQNCILVHTNASGYLGGDVTAYNCVALTASTNFFQNIPNATNTIVSEAASLFKTFGGQTYSDSETFELTDEAKAKYFGTDGKEVGLYGGSLPYDATPSNPQITKFDVASRSDADGMLSVDIEVGVE